MLGYISYPVRAVVQNPLHFFRCNHSVHVAEVCKWEIPRCGKCAGGHATEDSVVSVDKVVCVNCRGARDAGDRRCLVRERQISAEDGSRVLDPERIPVNSRFVPVQRNRVMSELQ
jgi:hypothetical protein